MHPRNISGIWELYEPGLNSTLSPSAARIDRFTTPSTDGDECVLFPHIRLSKIQGKLQLTYPYNPGGVRIPRP